MFKKITILVLINLFLFVNMHDIKAEDRVTGEYGSYDKATKIIQEVMRDYYIKEDRFQYNYSRADYGHNSPEEATIQDNKHLVCASYTYSTYAEAFGVDYSFDKFPIYNYSITDAGANYYNANKDNNDKLDGNYLIYYEKKADNIKYVYQNKTTINDFAKMIQPGDLFTYTGHAMIAYKTVERTPGNFDVLMLNSTGGSVVRTRIDGTSKIFHNITPSPYGVQNVISVDHEGTVKYFWLSETGNFVTDGTLSCKLEECTVIRPFYKGENNKAIFNYSILPSKYEKSELRLEYPGLYIEKTVDKIDNSSVYLNDELEYTITIINKSNTTFNGKDYDKFYVVETLEDYVEYVSSSGVLENNKIKFTINKLETGKSIELKYKVKVKNNYNNIGKEIISTGEFKKDLNSTVSISTGVVTNYVVSSTKAPKKTYNECFNVLKSSKSGLELINEIYKCSFSKNFQFDSFDFTNLFTKKVITAKGATNAIVFKTNLDEKYLIYKNMILNNLWSGMVEIRNDGVENSTNSIYTLPRWGGSVASTRARNINPKMFKDGDILIYSIDYSKTPNSLKHTKEDGIYAYIYLDGKFVGVNGAGETTRNEFTYDYYKEKSLNLATHLFSGYNSLTSDYDIDGILEYVNYETLFDKDYYVILRPELVIEDYEEILKEDVKASTYIIGNYMFTREKNENYDGFLTTKKIMLAAKTLSSNKEADMIIYYKKANGEWIDALTGNAINVPNSFQIKVKDLDVELSEIVGEIEGTEVAALSLENASYVIGNHIFTRETNEIYDGRLTTRIIMLASKTVVGTKETDMIIYYKKANGEWIDAITGKKLTISNTFKIKTKNLKNV